MEFLGLKDNANECIPKEDILVLQFEYEGITVVILEAMTCGIPVISTDCPSGPDEIITKGKSGKLVPPADEEASAEAMLTLLQDENLRKKGSTEEEKEQRILE